MKVLPLFATPVAFFEYPNTISKEVNKFVDTTETHSNMGNTTSNNRYVLKERCFSSIKKFINESVSAYFNEVFCPAFDVKLEITQSWLNYTKKDQWHHKHRHPNSLVSGVFYINANDNDEETFCDRIVFHKEEPKEIEIFTKQFNHFNSPSWWFAVKTNMLVLFPSVLSHNVDPVVGDKTRISLAFNTFPKGYIGYEDNLTALHL